LFISLFKLNFLVVGTVRNCEKYLKKDISNIKKTIGKVKKLNWFLVESDSDDKTINILKSIKNKLKNFRYISLGNLSSSMKLRTQRIAFARNQYVKEIRTNKVYQKIDYVIVADFDGINSHINETSFNSCWTRTDWEMCSANQIGPYYDMWALRAKNWLSYDYKAKERRLKKKYPKKRHLHNILYPFVKIIPPKSNWIKVISAFGGFAIYKKKCFLLSSYNGLYKDGNEVCEHVPFHLKLVKKKCRLFINPGLTNAHFSEHTQPASFWKIIRRFLKKKIKNFYNLVITIARHLLS
jgi:hypothetical protein